MIGYCLLLRWICFIVFDFVVLLDYMRACVSFGLLFYLVFLCFVINLWFWLFSV